MDPLHIAEIVVAVIAAIGGMKGYEYIKVKNGRGSHTLTEADRLFLEKCFMKQSKELSEVIRAEGKSTRAAIYETS